MRFGLFSFLLLISMASGLSLAAQEVAVREPLELTESGKDYLSALRYKRIETEVAYFDPTRPPPKLDTNQRPEPAQQAENKATYSGPGRVVTGLISAALLVGVLYLALRFGGGMPVSLQATDNKARRKRKEVTFASQGEKLPGTLAQILQIADRREALVKLAETALGYAIAANGLLFRKSWTARDALRRLPRDQSHLTALRSLVMASERVHFGGRDISEEEFRALVEQARPIFWEAGK